MNAAREMGRVLMVGQTFEYNAAVELVERLIEQRELRNIHYIYPSA